MSIRPLPVPTRLFGGESLISYAVRHAARNGTSIADLEKALQQTGAMPNTRTRTDPRRLEAWRRLGALNHRAFATPDTIDGAAVVDRPLCLQCTNGHGGTGRLPTIGWVCTRHRRWIGPTQTDIRNLAELITAERHYRRILAPRGVLVRSPTMEVARDCALSGTSRNLIAGRAQHTRAPSPDMLVYPETVRIARLITSPSFNERILSPALAESDRNALTAHHVNDILPAAEDSEPWRATHRIADIFNTVARDRAKRLWHSGQDESLEPNRRGWATWGY